MAPALPRLRTESGISDSSNGSVVSASLKSPAASAAAAIRPASPASSTSDRAPTPTQALHQQLTGSSTSSGRTTPTATSQVQQQQQQLGLQPSIKLNTGINAQQQQANLSGMQRRASPLSQQSSSHSDGHRSITPTQAASGGIPNGAYSHDSDEETEETISRVSQEAAPPGDNKGKHRTTPSNASSTMSSPKTPSSGKSGSSSGHQHQGSLFRNKLRKALSLSELNNSTSTLSSGDTSTKNIGRSSLTSNSSSSDTSHSTAEPRTPPNGVSPVLPSNFASASASNLHSGLNNSQSRPMPNGPNSLPSNTGRRFGILNAKMNSSTDNISISSTVSSASMMLRKMGNFGKLARKSSVRSLSNLFHRDKDSKGNDEDESTHNNNGGGRATSDAVSEFGVPGAAMLSSKDRKKGGIANPSVAHVTVELERGEASKAAASGMTPAEALVRSHQERERIQREEQEKLRLAQLAASTSSTTKGGTNDTSPRSKLFEKEKERLKSQGAGKKSLTKKFSFGAFQRSASSSSLRQEALNAAALAGGGGGSKEEVRGTDSPHSSSSSSSTHPSPIFDSSATSSSSVSPVIYQHELDTNEYTKPLEVDFRPSLDGIQFDSWRKTGGGGSGSGSTVVQSGSLPTGAYVHHGGSEDYDSINDDDDEGFDDRTPRQSVEMMADQHHHHHNPHQQPQQEQQYQHHHHQVHGQHGQYSDWDGEPPNASFFEDDTASFRDESDHTSRSNASNQAPFYLHEPEEYSSDSGADGRNGQAIPKRPPPHARPSKGILKSELCLLCIALRQCKTHADCIVQYVKTLAHIARRYFEHHNQLSLDHEQAHTMHHSKRRHLISQANRQHLLSIFLQENKLMEQLLIPILHQDMILEVSIFQEHKWVIIMKVFHPIHLHLLVLVQALTTIQV